MNSTLRTTLGALIVVATIPAAALAQPERQPDRPASIDDETTARDRAHQRLQRQLESTDRQREALQDALDKLEGGAPLEEVRAAAMPDQHTDRRRERRPDRPRHEGPDAEPPTPEQIDRLMEFLEETNPEIAEDLRTLRDTDPEAFDRKLAEIHPRVRAMRDRFEGRPERFRLMMRFRNLERRSHELARQIVTSGDADAGTDLALELRETVAEGFEVRRQMHDAEIDELRERLDEMESKADEWHAERDQMIDRHIAELIDHAASGEPLPSRRDRFRQLQRDRQERRPRERGTPRRDRPESP